jgi:hypothetical protein
MLTASKVEGWHISNANKTLICWTYGTLPTVRILTTYKRDYFLKTNAIERNCLKLYREGRLLDAGCKTSFATDGNIIQLPTEVKRTLSKISTFTFSSFYKVIKI